MNSDHKQISYEELLTMGKERLRKVNIPDADLDAWYLLEYVIHITRSEYFLKKQEPVSQDQEQAYVQLLQKRQEHIPLQHITGQQEFMGLPFMVNKYVLVPRQDTECLVEQALPYVKGKKVLDMCTGSGCIGISLMKLGQAKECVGCDISKDALETAGKNAQKNQTKMQFVESDMFQKVTGRFDVIVSNPPYIPPKVIEGLAPEVKLHEPMLALDGGEDGLDFYRIITHEAKEYLQTGGWLFVEIGHDQKDQVVTMFQKEGYEQVTAIKDYGNNDRVVYGCWMER